MMIEAQTTHTPGALHGLRVIEMGQLIAGPFAGKTLGEFGADVVKIEAPGGGDPLRNWRLVKDGTSVWWQVQSRNKRSIALDLRSKDGQDIAKKLVAQADVLIENFRPGTLEGSRNVAPDRWFAPSPVEPTVFPSPPRGHGPTSKRGFSVAEMAALIGCSRSAK